jgi:hypothetical protein
MTTSNRKIKIFFYLSLLIMIIGAGIFSWQHRKQLHRWVKQQQKQESKQTRAPKQLACSCTNQTLKLKSADYKTVHLPKLKNNKSLTFIDNEKTKQKLLKQGRLIPIEERGFRVKKLTHSSRHLTPKARDVLEELAQRFKEQMKGSTDEKSYIRISSLTRTHEQQKSLSNISKAATKNISAHSFGQAFDIDFVISKDCSFATKTLEMLLNEM